MQTCFNYPLYYAMSNAIGSSQSMHQLSQAFVDGQNYMGDISNDMGIFFENHDNARWINQHGGDEKKFKTAIACTMTWLGIPFIYYGAEQGMSGGNDPDNRQPLWQYGYSQTSNYYTFIQKINKMLAKLSNGSLNQKELLVQDNFYAFSRGDKFVTILTNG